MIGQAHGWGTFPKCGPRLSYCLIILGPLFWECPHPRALPYTYVLVHENVCLLLYYDKVHMWVTGLDLTVIFWHQPLPVTFNESMIEIRAWNLNHCFKNLHYGTSLGRVLHDLNGTRIVLESSWRKFVVWLEAALCPWVQILEKRRDLMPTP
jgi:hypothetical protein